MKLARLVKVYGLVEAQRSAELASAHAFEQQAARARDAEAETRAQAAGEGRAALMVGDREQWARAEAVEQAALVRQVRLEAERTARQRLVELAAERQRLSRLDKEQIEAASDRLAQRAAEVEGRRTQAAADDRFAARRAWTENSARAEMKTN